MTLKEELLKLGNKIRDIIYEDMDDYFFKLDQILEELENNE